MARIRKSQAADAPPVRDDAELPMTYIKRYGCVIDAGAERNGRNGGNAKHPFRQNGNCVVLKLTVDIKENCNH